METRKKIELSPTEVTAYWWINSIKGKVRDIVIHNSRDYNEHLFINIFYGYTEVDWRNMQDKRMRNCAFFMLIYM